ncbi:hypothetical protein MMC07_005625 [Pseudocyphellaria aurata]|nr:hypothetical protein [Pseudocyphellaria aurata]
MTSDPAVSVPTEKKTKKPNRASRPNYNQIHAHPLPINIFPLPSLVPHNPLSILHIALTYLFQLVVPPSHPQPLYQGCFTAETRSVHITDEKTIRALWEQGFFGKGSLSRSEPSWLDREKRRKGARVNETSEEVTKRRREERREFKKERARKEREAFEEKLNAEVKHTAEITADKGVNESDKLIKYSNNHRELKNPPSLSLSETRLETSAVAVIDSLSSVEETDPTKAQTAWKDTVGRQGDGEAVSRQKPAGTMDTIFNQEHLQLTPEEAFFLAYGLGVLQISSQNPQTIISSQSLLSLFRQNSYFPPLPSSELRPDDPFLLSYVVYHHFRSLGWVVRPGIKFAVDFLLYNRGPAFSHAEFAVVVVPSYRHPYWLSTATLAAASARRESRSWWWLHCVNRVQSQVRKSLLLVYVEVPPAMNTISSAEDCTRNGAESPAADVDITGMLKQYRIRELTIRRWTPNRSRD